MGSGRGSGGRDGVRSKGFELSWKHTVLGCLVGMLFGLLMGALMGGPMALSAYGSTKDAIVSGMLRTFSLDQNKTDIPDIQPAMHLEAHWDEVVRFILWDHLFTVLIVCACVGLVFGLVASLANQIGSQVAFSSAAAKVEDQHAALRRRLLPMR